MQLEVKVAEISRTGLRKMGLGFLDTRHNRIIGVFGPGSGAALGMAAGGLDAAAGKGIKGTTLPGMGSEVIAGPSFEDAFLVVLHSLSDDILAIISILKAQGLTTILAEPTLVATSGREAKFQVGGEFPVTIDTRDGLSTEFKEYGVILGFMPTVIEKETINLEVATEVSERFVFRTMTPV